MHIFKYTFYKLKDYLTTNKPPFQDSKNPEIFKNYIQSELCDLTNSYF